MSEHTLPPSSGPLPGSFTPVKYAADGGFSLGGALQLTGVLGLVGMILGVLASLISRWIYFVVLFPIAIGMFVGWAGIACIKRFHIRNPLLCGLAGFLAGCLAMTSMHYADYRYYEHLLNEALGEEGRIVREIALRIDEIQADWDNATPEEKEIVTELRKDPNGLRALRANDLFRYLDMQAHNGVELNPRAGRGGRGLNLGYTGSWIYWAVETLIVAGIAYALMSGAAAEPYCNICENWKVGTLYGPFRNAPELARQIEEGNLTVFSSVVDETTPDGMVTIFTCPECEETGELDVRVERWTVNNKGETSKHRLVQMTYPAGALAALQAACALPREPEPDADDGEEEVSSTDSTSESSSANG